MNLDKDKEQIKFTTESDLMNIVFSRNAKESEYP